MQGSARAVRGGNRRVRGGANTQQRLQEAMSMSSLLAHGNQVPHGKISSRRLSRPTGGFSVELVFLSLIFGCAWPRRSCPEARPTIPR